MSETEQASDPIHLLDHVWETICRADSTSYAALNTSMRQALGIAVGGGMTFKENDFNHIFENYKSGYWIGESSEDWYAMAIMIGNTSAIKAFEFAKGRASIIADDVSFPERSLAKSYCHVHPRSRKKERLATGFTFPWNGEDVIVTSFGSDENGTYVTACSHEDGRKHYGKVLHRYKINRANILAARKAAKETAVTA